jgi:hypothetical protein
VFHCVHGSFDGHVPARRSKGSAASAGTVMSKTRDYQRASAGTVCRKLVDYSATSAGTVMSKTREIMRRVQGRDVKNSGY